MRMTGHVLLWIGVLGAAFVSVREASVIDWTWYGLAAALAVVGVILLRLTAGAAASRSDRLHAGLETLRASLSALCAELPSLRERHAQGEVYGIKTLIDTRLAPHLANFADAREAMIPAFGIQGYADVMTRFAAAERLINRAWSASADGYIDEVGRCLDQVAHLLGAADERLAALLAQRASATPS